ncbi:karyopherin beta [Trypanosoma rangeli]|uniref:Karyopherin beta n=1 Tax=Trypanosoma rangeli TaxID=5698 RepID=A0A3R7MFW4_TRYRA|nr:karyopherin beta [Trypanosoma rangeli]RNF01772.1 karyopherin beta [Trypanosoma rangeli]|eukprot:RNF01772.1 karyopherin beta [Trypanosoma rangeli]
MDQAQLLRLIDNLRSPDNSVRKSAEAEYESLSTGNSVWMMCSLSELCAATESPQTMQMGMVLLRKLFSSKSNCYDVSDAQTQRAVKDLMLQVLGKAAFGPQRALAAACVSALVVKMHGLGQEWDELWQSVFQILENAESAHQLKTICSEIIAATGPSMASYFEAHTTKLVTGIRNCLTDPFVEARKSAFDALVNVAMCRPMPELAELVPLMLQVVQDSLNASNWDDAEKLTGKLADGVANAAGLFAGHTSALLQGLMEVASTPSVGAGARHMAIEALLTYCESEPRTVRKVPHFSASFLQLLFEYTLNPEMPDDWDEKGINLDGEDLEDDKDDTVGSSGIDRLASALGGRKLDALAQRLFMENIHSPDWKRRNAALLLITYLAEGMATVLEKHLEQIVQMVIPAVQDEVKYVRASALDCLTQMSSDFAPKMQEQLSHAIVPAVMRCLSDSVPAVATRAARCLDSFFDQCEESESEDDTLFIKLFESYIEGLCVSLVTLLKQTSHGFVRDDCLGALSSVISTCKGLLKPYTSHLVPVFQEILAMPEIPETVMMKCKAIECTTLLACGVGREVFAPYAHDMCNYLRDLLNHLARGSKDDDMRLRYVLRGWTCMTDCLREEVTPYLDIVMPVLISMMNVECDTEVENAEVGDDDDDDEDEDGKVTTMRVVVPGVGVRRIKLHTGLIEEKDLAASVVSAMLSYVGKNLGPHLPQIMESAVKLISFQSDSSIRESGALILDGVMDAYDSTGRAQVAVSVMPPLLNQFAEEDDLEASSAMSVVISRCIDDAPTLVSPETVNSISEKILGVLQRAMESRTESLQSQLDENDDDELDKLKQEEEEADALIRDTCDLLDKMLERASAVFAPVFNTTFIPVLQRMLEGNEKDVMVARGLALLCSLVEHAPDHVASLVPTIVGSVINFAQRHGDADVLQSAFYLMNLLLQYFEHHEYPATQQFVQQVHGIIVRYLAVQRKEEYEDATCNVISTAVTLLSLYYQLLPEHEQTQMLARVVNSLPAGGDKTEACRVHERVMMWVVQRHPLLKGDETQAKAILLRLQAANGDVLSESTRAQLAHM